ncbi:Uncharacterised protein [Mycobacteroides abscessus subsp. abscessus]|nr:Uncharacterised protein [Mycobacteroides abscessus subsp. abscessus]
MAMKSTLSIARASAIQRHPEGLPSTISSSTQRV